MNQCICNFSNKADDSEMSCDHMCNNHASLEIPYHTILRILDTTRSQKEKIEFVKTKRQEILKKCRIVRFYKRII